MSAAHQLPVGPEPGFYPGVPFETYHAWPYVNASKLKLFRRTPAHARHELLHPSGPKPAMQLGTATHMWLLEPPELFEQQFLVVPKVDRRTKDGKAAWAGFEAEAAGRSLLLDTEAELGRGMVRSIWEHTTAGEILRSKGHNEASIVWDDPDTGTRCKARLDALRLVAGWPAGVDVKTTRDASPREFARQAATLGYGIQAGLYTRGLRTLFGSEHRFVFVAVESEAPHVCATYELDPEDLVRGERESVQLLERWNACERTGIWPGYSDQLERLSLPAWSRTPEGGTEAWL